jgi:predicted nucleotidyltransferase
MDRRDVLRILRDHEPELKADGIVHLRVFGSVARGEASLHSDVDLLADFDASKCITLVTLSRLQSRLSELLGAKVDLSSPDWMKEPVRTKAAHEAIHAF